MRATRFVVGLILAMICTFSFAQDAQAACNRGPWVYSGTSSCACSNGQNGSGDYSGGQVYVSASGPSNGWVGVEWEAYDESGTRVFVPVATYRFNNYQPIYANNNTSWNAYTYGWPWAANYGYSGRYRSVCMTNYSSFTYPSGPWSY